MSTDPLNLPPEREAKVARQAARLVRSNDFASINVTDVPAYFDVREEPLALKGVNRLFFQRAVNAAWLAHLSGKPVGVGTIVSEDPGLPPAQVKKLLAAPRFKQALEARGVPTDEDGLLSEKMIAALRVVSDPTLGTSERTRIKQLGIGWQEYRGWMDYEPFRRKYRQLMSKALDEAVDRGDAKLAELIDSGNLKAIEYANEKTGRFVRGQQEVQNFQQMLVLVLSALKRNVTDPVLLEKIAGELEQVIALPLGLGEDVIDAEVVGGDDDDTGSGLGEGGSGDE